MQNLQKIEELEEYAFYESGLSAHGCLERLDDYTRKCITKYGRVLLAAQEDVLLQQSEKSRSIQSDNLIINNQK
jgi:hypothetical protein